MTHLPIPSMVDDRLFPHTYSEPAAAIRADSPDWYAWLANKRHKSFSFKSSYGIFTARRERQRNSWYWYAYRKRDGKTHKAYLGKSEELTLERLTLVASALACKSVIQGASLTNSVSTQLLTAKFSPPVISTRLVARPHLLARLQAHSQGKLTLLSASAGWGKTALLSAWCAELRQQGRSFAWLTLDSTDNDPRTFWQDLILAIHTLQPGLADSALASLQTDAYEEAVKLLVHAFARVSADIVLCLDNYHTIESPDIHQTLTTFLDFLPPNIHVTLASRTSPPLPLARYRVHGSLLELRAAELAFTPAETYSFLLDAPGCPLAYEDCNLLTEQVEGWPAGLQLATLALQRSYDRQEIVSCTVGNRYISDYLLEEVFNRQPPVIQNFLLSTAILPELDSALCDAVRVNTDSQSILESLERLNLLHRAQDGGPQAVRYQRLFTDTLLTRLRQVQPGLECELRERARAYLTSQNNAGLSDTGKLGQCTPALLPVEPLTTREHDVLLLLMDGASNREIAQQLIISEGTVKKHVYNICSKLSVQRRTQVITKAFSLALV